MSVETDEQWASLAAVLDRPDLAGEPALANRAGRREAHDRLDAAIAAWAAGREVEAAAEELVAGGVPAAPARDPRLTARHPQFAARSYHEVVDHPVAGPIPVPTLPFRIDGVAHWLRSSAPTFGQHNDDILGGILGLPAEEIAVLRADALIGERPIGT